MVSPEALLVSDSPESPPRQGGHQDAVATGQSLESQALGDKENGTNAPALDPPPASSQSKNGERAEQSQNQRREEQKHSNQSTAKARARQNSKTPCKFLGTRNGCRAGTKCPYQHDSTPLTDNTSGRLDRHRTPKQKAIASSDTNVQSFKDEQRKYVPPLVDASKVVSRPVPPNQAQDPREFEIQQVRRRFSPEETDLPSGTTMSLKVKPSDPDFPYELDFLDCVLNVPQTYPSKGLPSLAVKNADMERGFQINVERGFDAIVSNGKGTTLLDMLKTLDRQLESLLEVRKAETVKFVANRGIPNQKSRTVGSKTPPAIELTFTDHAVPNATSREPIYSAAQKSAAAARREAETRQLEARLGLLSGFSKSSDGIAYLIPLKPRLPDELPIPLQTVQNVRLFVPLLYPLLPCRISLQGVARDSALGTEIAFERKAKESSEMSLMAHVNALAANMHIYASHQAEEIAGDELEHLNLDSLDLHENVEEPRPGFDTELDDRAHIHLIPRPPEWETGGAAGSASESDISYSESEGELSHEETDHAEDLSTTLETGAGAPTPERGIALSFPSLALYGVELLEVASLDLVVRCTRCKENIDIKGIRSIPEAPGNTGGASAPLGARSVDCPKCIGRPRVAFRREPMHAHSSRVGFLDLEDCTPVDLLPSSFVPTCAGCSVAYTGGPPLIAVRGDSPRATCRSCHKQMSFSIPEVKFLRVSSATATAANGTTSTPNRRRRRTRRDEAAALGIVTGNPLPHEGRCTHYARSYRWFRFGCCARVYPCDRCHDEREDHVNERAPRMLCGWCSREQAFRPEDCGFCRRLLVRKRGTGGFWEGGKGTRDRVRMSRKDPRKYRRRAGQAQGND